jgi:toxin FitB
VSFLVDTNVLSEIRKGARASANIQRWWAGVSEADVHLSVIVLGEIRRGIERKRHRNDLAQANALEAWLGRLETTFADRIMPIDAAVADLWGRLQVPDPRPVVDAIVAATALVHGLTVVTRNVREFAGTGVRVLDPYLP